MTDTVEREPTKEERKQDIKFLTGILMRIRKYAVTHGQEPDDTLRTVAEWILGLLEVATFNGDAEVGGMTNQEAINYLLNPLSLPEGMDIMDKLRWHEDAVDMAIEALKNSTDTLSRQGAIDAPSIQPEALWGKTVEVERPLADCEIISRLRDIQKQVGGSYAIDRAIEVIEAVQALPSAEPQWHECFEDDSSSFPDDDRMVLMSFSNFPTPTVGWFERDEEGGYWTNGEQKTLAEFGLFVDGWWELPKKPERN